MELEYEVTSRSQFVAAVKAACRPTYEEARKSPVVIRNGSATFTFKEGISDQRSTTLLREIGRTPAAAFDVA
jgi:hypothetical protein